MPPGPQDPQGGIGRGNQRAPFTLPLHDEPVKPRAVSLPVRFRRPPRNRVEPGLLSCPNQGGAVQVIMTLDLARPYLVGASSRRRVERHDSVSGTSRQCQCGVTKCQ
jgi:hypothetical protein